MALSERSRHKIYESFSTLIDDREAVEEMLSYFPARDVEEPVTKDHLRAELVGIRSEMAELGTDLRGEMAELRADMADFRVEVKGDISALRIEMHDELRRLQAQMLASSVGLATVIIAFSKLFA